VPDKQTETAALGALEASKLPYEVSGNNVTVEFRIQDLLSRIRGSLVESHCSGCLGCSGCKV
jgi:hypothetical protein